MKDSLSRLDGVEDRMSGIEKNMNEMKDMLKALSKQSKSGEKDEVANDTTSVLRMLDVEQVRVYVYCKGL